MDINFFILMKPELILTLLIFIFLFIKIAGWLNDAKQFLYVANFLLLINFAAGLCCNKTGQLFSGMYYASDLLSLEKSILNLGVLLISMLSFDWLQKSRNASEFYMLLLSSQLGMFFLLSSGNFLMFYLALELSTIPLAALSNFDLDRPRSSEAAFKLIMSSALASGILLFGISLLYGATGTIDFTSMIHSLQPSSPLMLLGFVFIFVGLGFKLSTVPFHLWTADVYEGSPVPVTATLAVISKGTIILVLMSTLFTVFSQFIHEWNKLLIVSIILTITVGNFMAVRQNNLKRLLAFSSIAQIGYLLLGIISGSAMGASSVVYFLLIYIFSSLAMFSVVSVVFTRTEKDDINDYRGFYQNNKFLSWVIALALFSLAGIPPTAGFFGKFFLLTAGASTGNNILLAIAIMNMVVSLYYYLRVVKAVFIDKSEAPMTKLSLSPMLLVTMVVCMVGILVIGFSGQIFEFISQHFYVTQK